MTEKISTDTLIVGAGLSGLRVADILMSGGQDAHLIEARPRIGGRVLSHTVGPAAYDLGPAWFWGGQPRISDLIKRFKLPVFEQYAQGDFRYEDAQGRIQQGRGAGSMQGSFRLQGGIAQLCHALAQGLPKDRIFLDTRFKSCRRTENGVDVMTASGLGFAAKRVIFALPPRLVADFTFGPALPSATVKCLQDTPTWMAGQAKALALYETPFWRSAGLSGDAMSQVGPMVEIHDASPADAGPFALFGFIGVPPEKRGDIDALKVTIQAQLQRLFGPDAAQPFDIVLKDWARDTATASPQDAEPLYAHPRYGMPAALQDIWEGRLVFAGSEVARNFGGYLEGALEAAEAATAIPAA